METVYRLYRYAEDKLDTNFYMLSTSFFVVFNLLFDLSLGTLAACILPEFIRKFKRPAGSDEEFGLLFPTASTLFDGDDELMNEHRRALRKRNLFLSSTRTVLATAILNGNVLGEWKTTVLSILQLAATGLCSGAFMYSNAGLLTNPINSFRLNSSNNARLLLLLHALKTGELSCVRFKLKIFDAADWWLHCSFCRRLAIRCDRGECADQVHWAGRRSRFSANSPAASCPVDVKQQRVFYIIPRFS